MALSTRRRRYLSGKGQTNPRAAATMRSGGGADLRIWVEALDDVSMRLAPFGRAEATAMLDELRGRALLDGGRGGPPVDRRALAQMISGVSRWLARAPWLRELDINPLIATGDAFIAVDARIRVAIPD